MTCTMNFSLIYYERVEVFQQIWYDVCKYTVLERNHMIELLAPAGSMDALRAAVQNGANAVYLGCGTFNARQSARNFTPETLGEAVRYCHVRGVQVHLTLNTLVSDREMDAAAELIRDAKKIVVCALGISASVAESLYAHLFRVGMPASLEVDAEFMQVAARMATPETVFVAISRNGRTEAVVRAFEEARRHGAKTISITTQVNTPLYFASDIPIIHYAPAAVMTSTRIVQNTIIDCLYVCATRHRQEDVLAQIVENREVASFLRIK